MHPTPRHLVLATLLALVTGVASVSAGAATITVNSSGDVVSNDGSCSLREAISAANGNAASGPMAGECVAGQVGGQDQILFAIAGPGPHTLQPASGLPDIVGSLSIDGYSQPGASANTLAGITEGFNAVLMIRLEGSQSGALSKPGFRVLGPGGSNVRIRGLEIFGYASPGCCADAGIVLSGATQNVSIVGNLIRNNNWRGVFTIGAHANARVGGPLAADRNMLHSQAGSAGIEMSDCTNCVVETISSESPATATIN